METQNLVEMSSEVTESPVNMIAAIIKKNSTKQTIKIIETLANHFNFDVDEAERVIGIEHQKMVKKAKEPKAKIDKARSILPWCGTQENWCHALKVNHGLYSQCVNPRSKESLYCTTCKKSAEKNEGVPPYGTTKDREAVAPMEYKDKKGNNVLPLMKVLTKLKVSLEEVKAEASKFNMEIPEENFEESSKKSRGRPKKESDDETKNEEKKPRGRPKKEKKAISDADDLISQLVIESQPKPPVANDTDDECVATAEPAKKKVTKKSPVPKKASVPVPVPKKAVESESEAEEEIKVKKFIHKGVTYLKSTNNIVYDFKTQDEIGIYDETSKTIIPNAESEEEEDEE